MIGLNKIATWLVTCLSMAKVSESNGVQQWETSRRELISESDRRIHS